DDSAAPGSQYRGRPEHQDPAPVDALPAVHLDLLWRLPAGRPVHLLDRVHPVLTGAAIPDHRLGWDVPAPGLGSPVRQGPQAAFPGGHPNRGPRSTSGELDPPPNPRT